jgi:hypothetical protein
MMNVYFDAWTDEFDMVRLQPMTYREWRNWRAGSEYVHHFQGAQYNVWVCSDDVCRRKALAAVARLLMRDTVVMRRWCLINLMIDEYIVPTHRINEFLSCDNPDDNFDRK